MNRFLAGFLILAATAVAEQTSVISTALKGLYSEENTEQKLPDELPLYMKIIPSKTSERSTLVYRCRYISAKTITDSIESATSPTGTVETSDDQNMITVNDVNEQIMELRELILSLDTRGPQVLVEAQIVEVQMGDGVEWDTGLNISYDQDSSGGFQLGGSKGFPAQAGAYPDNNGSWVDVLASPSDMVNVNARLRWLESSDKAEILSSPNLLVDLGHTATVSTGTDQPLLNVSVNNGVSQESVYYKRTGVNLRVTPLLINEDTVNIQVRPEVTTVVGTAQLSAFTDAPIISVRNIDTKLNVRDGGVIMMGGLYSSREIEREERVPILSSIPFLGKLFTGSEVSEEQVQLIFLLKVTIVPDSSGTILTNLDSTKDELKVAGQSLRESIFSTEDETDKDAEAGAE